MAELRLIDANTLIKKFEDDGLGDHSLIESVLAAGVYAGIENAPTIDAVPVAHARWVQEDEDAWRCTCCGAFWTFIDGGPEENDARFCPVCGAKMDGGATDG